MGNRRCDLDRVVQRQVLYLGEINDSQEAAWRRTLTVFDESRGDTWQLALFPEDRPIPPEELNALSLRMNQIELRRPRTFGACWLGLHLWRELQLDQFWTSRLSDRKGEVPWEKVLAIPAFRGEIEALRQSRKQAEQAPAWFQQHHPQAP